MSVNLNSIMGVPYQNSFVNDFTLNPVVIIIIVVVLILYFTLFSNLGGNTTQVSASAGNEMVFFEVLLWGVFVLLIIMNGMTYIFNIDITASIKNIFSSKPEIDIVVDPDDQTDFSSSETTVPEIKLSKQVFHVPDNKYSYTDSKAICKAYGGRLATWKEIDKAYKKGADWCSMGWSDGQMALYPTQYNKWVNLQSIDGHEQDCGRPGINGGYIANPNVKFGVNCYGYKPKITPEEAEAMKLAPLYPSTVRERAFDKRVDYWKNQLPNLQVSPFNHDTWSVL